MEYQLKYIKNYLPEVERKDLYSSIDDLPEKQREWNKVDLLINYETYLDFLKAVTGSPIEDLKEILGDYKSDDRFKDEFEPKLNILKGMEHAGDLRFHAITLYVLVRALKPRTIIETGVAQGKSSAILLLGLYCNGTGNLKSIDLPNYNGTQLEDGAFTSTGAHPVGWMVPSYLRSRWELILGDAKVELPKLIEEEEQLDMFFHDSLHTYEHVKFEIETIMKKMKKGFIVVDNLETEAGHFFEDFVIENQLTAFVFGNLGIININKK